MSNTDVAEIFADTVPSQLEIELQRMASFVKDFKLPDSTSEMEDDLTQAIGYRQRMGEVLNDAELVYAKKFEQSLADLNALEDETETTRKAKLGSWTAGEKHRVQTVRNLYANLKSIQMLLFSAIKTRRTER